MTGDAIVYYRSRPSEPEASGLALRLQREAVRERLEKGALTLAAEFIEHEGEAGSEGCPAFVAARHAAQNAGRSMLFIIASRAAIGSGEVFQEPDQPAADSSEPPPAPDGMCWLVLWDDLLTPSVPAAPEIVLPAGAPGPLCLYADCRPRQLDNLIYLCNAGPDALADVVVTSDAIGMNEFFSAKRGEEPWAEGRTGEQRFDLVTPGSGVLADSFGHGVSDYVTRHRLAYTDAAGRRRMAAALDLNLRSCLPPDRADDAWVAFQPVA